MDEKNPQTVPERSTTASTEPVQPTPIAPTTPTSDSLPVMPSRGSSKRKKMIIGLVLAVVLALLASGALAYAYYTKPENVVADAFKKTIATEQVTLKGGQFLAEPKTASAVKGSMAFDGKASIKTNVSQFNAKLEMSLPENRNVTLNGSIITTQDDTLYVRVENVKQIINLFFTSLSGEVSTQSEINQVVALFDPILKKVDNKWVKITPQDFKDLNQDPKTDECSAKLNNLKLTKDDQNKLSELYKKHTFVIVRENLPEETLNGKQSHHYRLGFDAAKFVTFTQEAQKLSRLQPVKDCLNVDEAKEELEKDTAQNPPTVELWIEKWSHQITRVQMTTEDKNEKTTLKSDVDLNAEVKVDAPTTNITTVKDLQTEYEKLLQSFGLGASSGLGTGATQSSTPVYPGIMTQ